VSEDEYMSLDPGDVVRHTTTGALYVCTHHAEETMFPVFRRHNPERRSLVPGRIRLEQHLIDKTGEVVA
jgi:hypothetical protein